MKNIDTSISKLNNNNDNSYYCKYSSFIFSLNANRKVSSFYTMFFRGYFGCIFTVFKNSKFTSFRPVVDANEEQMKVKW
jgi:hypothetical protein